MLLPEGTICITRLKLLDNEPQMQLAELVESLAQGVQNFGHSIRKLEMHPLLALSALQVCGS